MTQEKLGTRDPGELCRGAIFDPLIQARRLCREKIIQQEFDSRAIMISPAVKFLKDTLNDGNSQYRRRSAELLGHIPDETTQLELFEIAHKDPSWSVREYACKSLGQSLARNPRNASEFLTKLSKICVGDSQALVRSAAREALLQGQSDSLKATIEYLELETKSKQFTRRKRALKTLGKLTLVTQIGLSNFVALLDDSHVKVRMAASREIIYLANQGHDFRFALPALVRRSFDQAGMAGYPARSAVIEIAERTSVTRELSRWILDLLPGDSYHSMQGDRSDTTEGILKAIKGKTETTPSDSEPIWRTAFQQTCKNRVAWAEKNLSDSKIEIVKAIMGLDIVQAKKGGHPNFAIKEAVWMLGQFIRHQVDMMLT